MAKSSSSRTWRRSAVAGAVGLCLATLVYAQQTAGSISGTASRGDVVTVSNPNINITRQITVGADGAWTLTQLPAGAYTVTLTKANGTKETREVQVAAGEGAYASFAPAQTITVTGGAVRSIDMGSTTTNFGIRKDAIDRLPVAKDITSVALLAPGAVAGDGRFGNVASLGGASPAENAYYINGFNVTNIVTGLAFNTAPFEAIAEQQVLSSGYSVEFGRSLGGVLSINTKRGTNEWTGGVTFDYSPAPLRGSSVYAEKSAQTGRWQLNDRAGTSNSAIYNLYGGGPIVKDKLYFFGLLQGQDRRTVTFGQDTGTISTFDSPQYLMKLDWNLNDKNLVEFTAFSDKSVQSQENFAMTKAFSAFGAAGGVDKITTGGDNYIAKWTSFLTSDFTVSALAGIGKYSRSSIVGGADCPAVYDSTSGTLVKKGCWSESFLTVDDPTSGDERKAVRLDAEWQLGQHQIRFGLDKERYTSSGGTIYSGGTYYRVFAGVAPNGTISGTGYTNTTGARIPYVRVRVLKNGGTFATDNSAWYVEDNYKLSKNLLLNFGVRGESFTNYNDASQPFIDVKNTISPRGGFAWDLDGNGTSKLYANAGRYYIPVYSNTNLRLAGTELFTQTYYRWDGKFSTDGRSVPGLLEQLGSVDVLSDGKPRNPATLVDTKLKPMFQDELVLGFQRAIGAGWTGGVKATYRKLKSTMDDFGDGVVVAAWAKTAGYTPAQVSAIQERVDGYILMNPGRDLTFNVDFLGDGKLTEVTVPASALKLPKPKRTYESIELMLDRPWDKKWSANVSYVLAWSRGNTEGYVKSDIAQDDAGITQDWDHPSWMEGSYGNLPNDRRHTLKLNGAWAVTDQWRVSSTAVIQSGRPVNCFGVYAGTLVDGGTGPNSFYCNGVLVPRGSVGRLPWTRDISLQVSYAPYWAKGLTLSANILNVFNERGVRAVSETGEDSGAAPDVNYLRPSLDALQAPRRVRLTAAYNF